jgi:hypothetical protein
MPYRGQLRHYCFLLNSLGCYADKQLGYSVDKFFIVRPAITRILVTYGSAIYYQTQTGKKLQLQSE